MNILTSMAHKLGEALQTAWGWAAAALSFCAGWFAGSGTAILITLLAVVLDGVWGIAAALKQGRFALSELARESVMKMTVYGTAVICFIGIDKLLGIESGMTLAVVCAVIVLTELWSICANALICYPDMPFLKLMRRALIGEIARKLGVREDDVRQTLDAMEKAGRKGNKENKDNRGFKDSNDLKDLKEKTIND